ncbi:hypothetical protein MKW92_000018 [Papaver armeniacum]|nr:hypothetical protein MKW92_000018 [Papaver armeniacum]
MLFFLISCVSFIFLSKSLSLKSLPSWLGDMRLFFLWFWRNLLSLLVNSLRTTKISIENSERMSFRKKLVSSTRVEHVEEEMNYEMSVLDLPELALESILGRLSPSGLCSMAAVCSSMRDRCRSDYLWKRHMDEKWGKNYALDRSNSKSIPRSLSCVWPLNWFKSKLVNSNKPKSSLPADSIMSWYLSLETGNFWFPAQVYNREHGHVGFMLSCYDAELSYDSRTDTFHARYPPHGRRTIVIEEGVEWDRIRAPAVDTLPHDLHVSDCWWYGIAGHLEHCDGDERHCLCHTSDTVVLEFNQYTHGSRWRQTFVSRKDHREEGNETDGFYGGIRKLYAANEISMWKQLWPTEVLE